MAGVVDALANQPPHNGSVLLPLWPQFVEIKARRDIGIHNNWVCNQTYLRKVAEAGLQTSVEAGQSLIPGYVEYLSGAINVLHEIGRTIRTEVQQRYA